MAEKRNESRGGEDELPRFIPLLPPEPSPLSNGFRLSLLLTHLDDF
ncbi:hypothetical protein COLO4_36749 [Corchorus olitorius]|uniref:Uncharacterized protein n=1 Tax=Corchorus olitorius TaxID=93759 RepID=A0A1R3G5P9_9ROSI|nr:hypothetical protein COLO4_36749 [Corchorus olitorius]